MSLINTKLFCSHILSGAVALSRFASSLSRTIESMNSFLIVFLCFFRTHFHVIVLFSAAWLSISAVVCALIALIEHFYIMVICFMLFLSAGLCAGIISAISVELFPTNYRAMATCLILMLGRVGAVGGSNFVSSLLHVNCELMFYLYSGLIFSE